MTNVQLVCPSCIAHTLHTPEDAAKFHPLMGHGKVHDQPLNCTGVLPVTHSAGWCCQAAEDAHNAA